MTTLCNLTVPAEEFGLAETLRTVPDAQIAYEPVATSSPTESRSLIRARAPDCQRLEPAFTSDSTVVEWTRLTGGKPGWLYQIEWVRSVSLVRRMLTGERASILSASGSGNTWTLRILYPSREVCSDTTTVCKNHNLGITVNSIRGFDGDHQTRYGLSDAQHTALVHAYEMDYFSIPREVDLEAVAETLDISHQALSERLRRAHQTLIETSLDQHGRAQTIATAESGLAASPEPSGGQRLPTD